jgi:hypothetical protein
MGNENNLDAIESWNVSGMFENYPGLPTHKRGRDPGMYFVAIFGDPADPVWTWRFGGHHLSFNFTISSDRIVSASPAFLGANPAVLPLPGQRLRLLGPEEDMARQLLASLDEAQVAGAVIAPVPPWDVTQVGRPRVQDGALMDTRLFWGFPLPADEAAALDESIDNAMAALGWSAAVAEQVRYTDRPKGLAVGDMSPASGRAMEAMIDLFLARFPDDFARQERSLLDQAGLERLHFAWAGPVGGSAPFYFRVQGPTLLVEYDNVQRGGDHAHYLWRSPANDFGYDVLAAHHRLVPHQ